MSKQSRETTADWIAQEIKRILGSHPRAEVERTMPVILLSMSKEFGYETLDPVIRARVDRTLEDAGCEPDMPAEQISARVREYFKRLGPSLSILKEVRNVMDTHYAALGKEASEEFRQMADEEPLRAPKAGEPKPEGSVSLDALGFPKRL